MAPFARFLSVRDHTPTTPVNHRNRLAGLLTLGSVEKQACYRSTRDKKRKERKTTRLSRPVFHRYALLRATEIDRILSALVRETDCIGDSASHCMPARATSYFSSSSSSFFHFFSSFYLLVFPRPFVLSFLLLSSLLFLGRSLDAEE